jgi:hypothetical protein
LRSCASDCCRWARERISWAKMAAVLVAARLCEPSSELHIAEDWYRRTALSDLLQLEDDQVNKDRLYRALDHLILHKEALEAQNPKTASVVHPREWMPCPSCPLCSGAPNTALYIS